MGMGSFSTSLALALALALLLTLVAAEDDRKVHIIYMGSSIPSQLPPKLHYHKLLQLVIGSEYSKNTSEYLQHWYHRSFYGCAAKLTDAEAEKMAGMEGVVSVFPSTKLELHTTRSWDFLGFPTNVQRSATESDMIIGVFDTGIWPESASFSDAGMSPIPAKWKGVCQQAANFACNKKIIGARFYKADNMYPVGEGATPRDFDGHGTHTAATAAGGLVPNANFYGYAPGVARGGVPGARIAVYKVCWTNSGCTQADILRAFDDAIADGVDIISGSIGSNSKPYFQDTIAIGSFHAMQKGILSSLSAGNSGPILGNVTNVAPWILSVAASSIDREFITNFQLGNGKILEGKLSINSFNPQQFPMIYGGDAVNSSFPKGASTCSSLNRALVKGKIVLCELLNETTSLEETFIAGAAGIVLRSSHGNTIRGVPAEPYPLPMNIVGLDNGIAIFSYIKTPGNPVGTMLKTATITDSSAPYIAAFSSRGPNKITPGILKPDLSAPGLNILAAYSPKAHLSSITGDTRPGVDYKIVSGTSMSCPHVSGVAAYLKSYYPDWSPAAIRSALMTTATPMDSKKDAQAELAYGAGQMNPIRALNPGLVYDASEADYVKFLCGQLSLQQIQKISSSVTSCPTGISPFAGNLNYPSISVATNVYNSFNQVFDRRLKNVVNAASVYKVTVTAPQGLAVVVTPNTLQFTRLGQELSFTVKVTGGLSSKDQILSASIEWSDGVHKVRSPIVAFLAT